MAWGENEEGMKADSLVPWLSNWVKDGMATAGQVAGEFLQGLQSSPLGACNWVCPPGLLSTYPLCSLPSS